jgi:hypothetical protein
MNLARLFADKIGLTTMTLFCDFRPTHRENRRFMCAYKPDCGKTFAPIREVV